MQAINATDFHHFRKKLTNIMVIKNKSVSLLTQGKIQWFSACNIYLILATNWTCDLKKRNSEFEFSDP